MHTNVGGQGNTGRTWTVVFSGDWPTSFGRRPWSLSHTTHDLRQKKSIESKLDFSLNGGESVDGDLTEP